MARDENFGSLIPAEREQKQILGLQWNLAVFLLKIAFYYSFLSIVCGAYFTEDTVDEGIKLSLKYIFSVSRPGTKIITSILAIMLATCKFGLNAVSFNPKKESLRVLAPSQAVQQSKFRRFFTRVLSTLSLLIFAVFDSGSGWLPFYFKLKYLPRVNNTVGALIISSGFFYDIALLLRDMHRDYDSLTSTKDPASIYRLFRHHPIIATLPLAKTFVTVTAVATSNAYYAADLAHILFNASKSTRAVISVISFLAALYCMIGTRIKAVFDEYLEPYIDPQDKNKLITITWQQRADLVKQRGFKMSGLIAAPLVLAGIRSVGRGYLLREFLTSEADHPAYRFSLAYVLPTLIFLHAFGIDLLHKIDSEVSRANNNNKSEYSGRVKFIAAILNLGNQLAQLLMLVPAAVTLLGTPEREQDKPVFQLMSNEAAVVMAITLGTEFAYIFFLYYWSKILPQIFNIVKRFSRNENTYRAVDEEDAYHSPRNSL